MPALTPIFTTNSLLGAMMPNFGRAIFIGYRHREMLVREGAGKPRSATDKKNEAQFPKTFLIDRESDLETQREFRALAKLDRRGQLFQKRF